jgi:hypothetical protein
MAGFIGITRLLIMEVSLFTKVVALMMQMLDKKPADEPMTTVEEAPADYEAE